MAIWTNPKPTIYRNLHEYTNPVYTIRDNCLKSLDKYYKTFVFLGSKYIFLKNPSEHSHAKF